MNRAARVRRWLVFGGDRLAVTAVLLAASYLVVGPLGHLVAGDGSHGAALRPVLRTFLSGDLLLVSIVVSVTSTFTTQEQASLGRQLERVEAVGEFRAEFEELLERPVSPGDPTRFLGALTGRVLSEAQTLADGVREETDAGDQLDAFLAELAERTRLVNEGLEEADATVDVVLACLDYDHSALAHGLRRLRAEHGDALADADLARVERLERLLRHFAAAQEYFKTLYLTNELAALSRRLVTVSLPVVLASAFVLLHEAGRSLGHDVATLLVVLALAPFLLLAAYTVRVAAITSRTRSAEGFVLDDGLEDDPF